MPPDIHFLPTGYLHLATNEEEAEQMRNNWKTQMLLAYLFIFIPSFCRNTGARVGLLQKDELQQRFPFMNFDDVLLGSYGNILFNF